MLRRLLAAVGLGRFLSPAETPESGTAILELVGTGKQRYRVGSRRPGRLLRGVG